MNWVRDRTRRFQWRPYFDQLEIDVQCEDIVARFMKNRGGSLSYPISTDDLTVMIEQDVSDLDLYANLSSDGRGIEGVSEFHRRKKPSVRIAKYLSQEPSRKNRLRSTLAHEYDHVVFHGFLWTLDGDGQRLNARRRPPPAAVAPGSSSPRSRTGWSGRPDMPAAPC